MPRTSNCPAAAYRAGSIASQATGAWRSTPSVNTSRAVAGSFGLVPTGTTVDQLSIPSSSNTLTVASASRPVPFTSPRTVCRPASSGTRSHVTGSALVEPSA